MEPATFWLVAQCLNQLRHCGRKDKVNKKNCNDTIGNRTRDLPDCSAIPQPTAPLRPEGQSQQKIPMTPSGIEPATFWLLAQSLNQLHHCGRKNKVNKKIPMKPSGIEPATFWLLAQSLNQLRHYG